MFRISMLTLSILNCFGGVFIETEIIKVLVVEDNVKICQFIADCLEESGLYHVVGTAHNGIDGLSQILAKEVDVALLDVVLPLKDGISILEELEHHPEKKPVCIMLSGVSHDHITQKALNAGADYFIVKPFDIVLLIKRIQEVYEDKKKSMQATSPENMKVSLPHTPEEFVSGILRKIPISPNLKGYTYLKTAILLAIEDKSMLVGITKILYPTVARNHHSTSVRVERAIRNAIENAWKRGHGVNFYKLIDSGEINESKPTNGVFISAVVEMYNSKYRP